MTNAAPPGPPEVPQVVWDSIVIALAAAVGWLVRHFTKKK